MNKKFILIGSGGHSKVLEDVLNNQSIKLSYICSISEQEGKIIRGLENISEEFLVNNLSPQKFHLINGIGFNPHNDVRKNIQKKLENKGYVFPKIISKTSNVSSLSNICDGVQILHNAVVNSGAKVNRGSLLNTGSIVEHDCIIGEYNNISPGAILCGSVKTGSNVYIGAGAIISNNISVGSDSIIGAGSIIVKNVSSRMKVLSSKTRYQNYEK